jgi:hypothetical protein
MKRARRMRREGCSTEHSRELASSTTSAKSERIAAQIPSAIVFGDVHMGQSPISPIPMGRATMTKRSMRASARMSFTEPRLQVIVYPLTNGDVLASHRTLLDRSRPWRNAPRGFTARTHRLPRRFPATICERAQFHR